MHALELTSLATVFVRHAEAHLALGQPVDKAAAESYWLATRYRHDYWSGRFAAHRAAIQRPGISHRHSRWREILPVMQEVLVSEPLTRCVAYHARLMEEHQSDLDLGGFASSALGSHVEARHRCLHLIVFGTGLPPEMAVELNRLRRLMEHFNDQLLALMRPITELPTYCFDYETTTICQRQLNVQTKSSAYRRLYTSFLQSWLSSTWSNENNTLEPAANPKLNAQLAQSVLQMFPSGLFDSFGLPQSQELVRLLGDSLECDGTTAGDTPSALSPLNMLSAGERPQLTGPNRRW